MVVTASYIAYQSFDVLLKSVSTLSEPNIKLQVLNGILNDLNEAEGEIRIYALTRDREYFKNYSKQIKKVNLSIDSLRDITSYDTTQQQRVDSIGILVDKKLRSLNAFIRLRSSTDTIYYSARALEEISNSVLDSTLRYFENREPQIITTVDTIGEIIPVVTEKEVETKGFFDKLGNLFSGKESGTEMVTDSVVQKRIVQHTQVVPDSGIIRSDSVIIQYVRNVLEQIHEEEFRNQQLLQKRELRMLRDNSLILSQIMDVISHMEEQERKDALHSRETAEEVARTALLNLGLVVGISLIIVVAFVATIFASMSRGNRYRSDLIHAKQEAEELGQLKEQFLANMSHEIRTPLNAIVGFSEQLAKTDLEAKQKKYVSALYKSSDHLLDTVNDILDFSKIEAGKLTLEKRPFQPGNVVEEVCDALMLRAEEKNVLLKSRIEGAVDAVLMGDAFRLKQVLLNLAGNAIKFTESGQVTVSVFLVEKDDEQITAEYSVEDTGIGIAESKLKTIFDEFNQADVSQTRRYGGTGLGLAISRRLVQLHGGTLSVESKEGEGSIFSFDLNYIKSCEPVSPVVDIAEASPMALEGLSVLLVDDDEFNILLTEIILKNAGMYPDFADDGRVALKMLNHKQYDVVLTDIHMPEFSGVELTKAIRAFDDAEKAATPVIAITANVMKDDLDGYLAAGMNDYILKPYREADVYSKLISVLGIEGESAQSLVNLHQKNNGSDRKMVDESIFSLDRFRTFAGGDLEALKLILDSFTSNGSANLQLLNTAWHNNDYMQMGEVAHKMLNTFAHLENVELTEALRGVEMLIKSKQDEDSVHQNMNRINCLAQQAFEFVNEQEKQESGLNS